MSTSDRGPELGGLHPKPGAAVLLETLSGHHTPSTSTPANAAASAGAGAAPANAAGLAAAEAAVPATSAILPPSSPRARAATLSAHPIHPEPHGPSLPERELDQALHPDRNEQLGHPGVDCWQLPPHAHRLPDCHEIQSHPVEQQDVHSHPLAEQAQVEEEVDVGQGLTAVLDPGAGAAGGAVLGYSGMEGHPGVTA